MHLRNIFSIVSLCSDAQSLEQLNSKKRNLLIRQSQLNDSLKIVEDAINKLKVEKLKTEVPYREAVVTAGTKLTANPTNYASGGDVIGYLDLGDSVIVLGWKWAFLKVVHGSQTGYMSSTDIVRDTELDSFIELLEVKFREEEARKDEAAKHSLVWTFLLSKIS